MKSKEKTVTLFRPVGPRELDLIKESNWEKFPPRLPEQPIFYPVLSKDYAEKIARDWNVKESGSGYVLEFNVKDDYLSKFKVQDAGGKEHQEYWIPAENLEEFNNNIVGQIRKIKSFYKWFVYIVKCKNETLYTGITNNLDKRLKSHNEGRGAKYTKSRGPVTLVKFFEFNTKSAALKEEYRIKQLSKNEKMAL